MMNGERREMREVIDQAERYSRYARTFARKVELAESKWTDQDEQEFDKYVEYREAKRREG